VKLLASYIGDRSQQSAQQLWDSLPIEYRENAITYTDFWEAYAAIFPSTRHLPVGKETAKTNHIENFQIIGK
jgi:IS1 family transposase